MARTIPSALKTRKVYPTTTVSMASANTEYSYAIPEGATEILLTLANSANTWRASFLTGQVAAGSAHNVPAGGTFTITGPVRATTIYFASSSASQTMVISFLYGEGG